MQDTVREPDQAWNYLTHDRSLVRTRSGHVNSDGRRSYIEAGHAHFLLLAAAVALLGQTPVHQLPVGPPVILLLPVDGGLVLATLEVVCFFAL